MGLAIDIEDGEDSWRRVEPLFKAIWPDEVAAELPGATVRFAYPEQRVMIDADGAIACHVGIYQRVGTWNGHHVVIGGVGGVLTRADCRGRGLAGAALGAAIQTLRACGMDFALAFCEPSYVDFYRAHRWNAFDGEVIAEQSGGRVRFEAMAPQIFDLRRAPRSGVIDLCGLPW
jgi:GNAT superfamily N-acetyltransferase